MGMTLYKRLTGLFLAALIFLILGACASRGDTETVWPGETWQRSTPEAQGVDSEKLMNALKILRLDKSGVESMVIIRNGYIIAEFNKAPFESETTHRINSCTKSFTSTLMGIAIDQGLVGGVDEPVMQYFPDYSHEDPRVHDITIQDLLTMRSGVDWPEWGTPYGDPKNPWIIVWQKDDWIRYYFSHPMAQRPGKYFNYDTLASQLLADIIHRSTNDGSAGFAEHYLFQPLGIDSWLWTIAPSGSVVGGTALSMTTEDLARLGYLYLHEGKWDGKRIVSKKWVRDAVSPHTQVRARGRKENYMYGYQWWILDETCYTASGYAGQHCYVLPDYNLVVAVNSTFETAAGSQDHTLNTIVKREIPAAFVSNEALPENQAAVDGLSEYLRAAEKPVSIETVKSTSSIEKAWAGRNMHFEEEGIPLKSIEVSFVEGKYILYYSYQDQNNENFNIELALDALGEYQKRQMNLQWDNVAGNREFVQYFRLLSISENSLRFEVIDSGANKNWYIVTLSVNGDDVELQFHTRVYDSRDSSISTFRGKVTEPR